MRYKWIIDLKDGQKLVKSFIVKTEDGEDPYLKIEFTPEEKRMIEDHERSLDFRLAKLDSAG